MTKFKVGDRVKIKMDADRKNSPYEGAVGEVISLPDTANGPYKIVLNNSELSCRLWTEPYLTPVPLEVGELVEVVNYPTFWNGAKGQIVSIDGDVFGVNIKLVEQFEEYPIGTGLSFAHEHLARTSIPVEESAPRDVVREALEAAKEVFKLDAQRYFEKGKHKKEEARWTLFDLMQEALDDLE